MSFRKTRNSNTRPPSAVEYDPAQWIRVNVLTGSSLGVVSLALQVATPQRGPRRKGGSLAPEDFEFSVGSLLMPRSVVAEWSTSQDGVAETIIRRHGAPLSLEGATTAEQIALRISAEPYSLSNYPVAAKKLGDIIMGNLGRVAYDTDSSGTVGNQVRYNLVYRPPQQAELVMGAMVAQLYAGS